MTVNTQQLHQGSHDFILTLENLWLLKHAGPAFPVSKNNLSVTPKQPTKICFQNRLTYWHVSHVGHLRGQFWDLFCSSYIGTKF